jgi:hypothetical protein
LAGTVEAVLDAGCWADVLVDDVSPAGVPCPDVEVHAVNVTSTAVATRHIERVCRRVLGVDISYPIIVVGDRGGDRDPQEYPGAINARGATAGRR